jgi:hypothetical protein
LPRDDKGNLNTDILSDQGLARSEGFPAAPAEFNGRKLSHAVDGSGPARDHHFAGKPGDYAVEGDYLYIYTGDGAQHQWKRIGMVDY